MQVEYGVPVSEPEEPLMEEVTDNEAMPGVRRKGRLSSLCKHTLGQSASGTSHTGMPCCTAAL